MKTVILSSARWSSFWLSKHHIAESLARRGNDVLYVDPPLSAGSLLRDRARWADARSARDEQAVSGLRVWRPVVVPGQNTSTGQRVNARLLRNGLHKRQWPPELTVAFSLEARGVIGQLPGRRVYYCTDSEEDQPGVDREQMLAWQRSLLASVDTVIACSRPLVERLERLGVTPVYVPHGCRPQDVVGPVDVAPELEGLPRPLVGYVGSLNFRVDADLLAAAERAAGPGTLVIAGSRFGPHAEPSIDALLARRGVATIGHVSIDRLPRVLASLDAGVVPYGAHPFNRNSFPLKILQLLAAGVPVVSTPNGATDELGPLVGIAESPDAFEEATVAAIAGRSPETDERRRAAARARTWDATVDALLAAVGAPW